MTSPLHAFDPMRFPIAPGAPDDLVIRSDGATFTYHPLMREFLLDSEVRAYRKGEVIFERAAVGSSLFGIASGSVLVEVNPKDPSITVPMWT